MRLGDRYEEETGGADGVFTMTGADVNGREQQKCSEFSDWAIGTPHRSVCY